MLIALAAPVITGLLSFFQRDILAIRWINGGGCFLNSGALLMAVYEISDQGPFRQGWLYLDALSAVFLMVVAVLSFTSYLFSVFYMTICQPKCDNSSMNDS